MKNFPSISVVMPVLNEENNLRRLFSSLKKQTYPKNKVEYLIIDDGSTDNTIKLSKKFGAKIHQANTHDIGLNKRNGIKLAKNDLVYCMDADMKVFGSNFFELLVEPFLDDEHIVGSFTKEFAIEGCGEPVKNSLLRFISYHPLQQDPLYAFLSPSIKSTIVKKKQNYYVCKFVSGKIPAVGRILYRKDKLMQAWKKEKNAVMDLDLETTEIVARAGYSYFAYVPKAKIRHYHAESLSHLIKKRIRNLSVNYLPNLKNKYYLWFDPGSTRDIIKIAGWIVWANLLFPEAIRGVVKSIVYRDTAFLWHPVVSITTTDAILWGFLSQKSGRKLAVQLIKKLIP